MSRARKLALVVEAYGGKALGGLAALLALPLRLLPMWPRKKRLTDIYLADPEVRAAMLPPPADAAQASESPTA